MERATDKKDVHVCVSAFWRGGNLCVRHVEVGGHVHLQSHPDRVSLHCHWLTSAVPGPSPVRHSCRRWRQPAAVAQRLGRQKRCVKWAWCDAHRQVACREDGSQLRLVSVWRFRESNEQSASSLLRGNVLAQNSDCFSNRTLFFSPCGAVPTKLLYRCQNKVHWLMRCNSQLGPASPQLCAINPCTQVQLLLLLIY